MNFGDCNFEEMQTDRSSSGSSQAESAGVSGLTTPHLDSGELTKNNKVDDKSITSKENSPDPTPDSTIFDIARDIESKLKSVLEKVDKNDDEINKRIDKLTKQISQLEQEIKNN